MLSVANLEVVYHSVVLVLKGVSLEVPAGGVVALLGPNGAGKTTTLRAITGLLDVHDGKVTKGTLTWRGQDLVGRRPDAIVRGGIAQVMEGRRCFGHLSIEENLLTGAYTRKDGKAAVAATLEKVYGYFPRLKTRRASQAAYTSGG